MNRRTALHIGFVTGLLFGTGSSAASTSPQRAGPQVVPPDRRIEGKTYAEWSAAWGQWSSALPAVDGHPFLCDSYFDVTLGQSGRVWFLATPLLTCQQTISIPAGTLLFMPMIVAGTSSLEQPPFFGCTADEQLAAAKSLADLIRHPFLEIDGVALRHVDRYRFASPQFDIALPVPNVNGVEAGRFAPCSPSRPPMVGTSVGDGYWAMIRPLSPGHHTIRLGGSFPSFGISIDTTYFVTVIP